MSKFTYIIFDFYFLLYSFIKSVTNKETKNIFLLLKIIYNLSLILSLHIALLKFILANNAFLALNLIFTKKISKLDI
jgi:Protein of unknown function (DUF3435)